MVTQSKYDVIIIGAGPAGIFAALELSAKTDLKILMIDKGAALEKRKCSSHHQRDRCLKCDPCAITCGWGGAGAFSDGKLTLSPAFGGNLNEIIDQHALVELIDRVDQVFVSFGASKKLYGTDEQNVKEIQRQAAAAGLTLLPAVIRHLGTENCYRILEKMYEQLSGKIDILMKTTVEEIICENGEARGVRLKNQDVIEARYLICCPGRVGAGWMQHEAERLGLTGYNNPVDIGVRVEVPAVIMENLTDKIYESKLVYFTSQFDDRVRTFCMNPHGVVVTESYEGIVTVNGHSFAETKTENTNFALLVSKSFTEPFNEPTRYGRYIASLANMLGDGVLVQRLGDLLMGRRSTKERIKRGLVRPTLEEATAGDLSLVLPYRYLLAIIEMLEALDKLVPGIHSRHTLLYGAEVKFYSFRLNLGPSMKTTIKNLYAAGDGAGVTRGLIQASATGLLAAEDIIANLP